MSNLKKVLIVLVPVALVVLIPFAVASKATYAILPIIFGALYVTGIVSFVWPNGRRLLWKVLLKIEDTTGKYVFCGGRYVVVWIFISCIVGFIMGALAFSRHSAGLAGIFCSIYFLLLNFVKPTTSLAQIITELVNISLNGFIVTSGLIVLINILSDQIKA